MTPKILKELRNKHGLTQSEIASLVFKTKMAWSHYETGKRTIDKAVYELLLIKLKNV